MKKLLPCFLFILFAFSSCEEDIDISAPYKDITVVYGLLDRNDTTHYIRIQKCYLSDDNAFLYTGIPDSTYYPVSLIAYILEYNSSGTKVDSIPLIRTVNDFPKDSGWFEFTTNILYKGTKILNAANNYQLVIIKPNGDTTLGTTHLCPNLNLPPPPIFVHFEGFAPPNEEPSQTYYCTSDPNSYCYQISMFFNYEEWVGDDSLNALPKKVVRHFAVFKPTTESECLTNTICFKITKTQFYSILLWNIPVDPVGTPHSQTRYRRSLSVDVLISVGAQDLFNYIKFNAPSLSYVQKVSPYTNVKNGIGIFSSRTSGKYLNIPIYPITKDSIINGLKTKHLNFVQ